MNFLFVNLTTQFGIKKKHLVALLCYSVVADAPLRYGMYSTVENQHGILVLIPSVDDSHKQLECTTIGALLIYQDIST